MIEVSEDKLNELKNSRYRVYSVGELTDGCECFSSNKSLGSESFCVTSVKSTNIKCDNDRFYYTTDDLSNAADWFPAQLIKISNNFVPCRNCKYVNGAKKVGNNVGKSISSNKCIVDVSNLPAFNEDLSVYEYRFYLTLFNDYSVKQCRYERFNLYDAIYKSSKYDLVSRLQNSDFLKSKDFVVINSERETKETVPVGLVINCSSDKYNIEYGTVYINMDNQVSIVWN